MQKISKSTPRIKNYRADTMTKLIYSCNGAMEDWAYAYSWSNLTSDQALPKGCFPTTFPFDNKDLRVNTQAIRLPLYLVETADQKAPDVSLYGSRRGVDHVKCCGGHIPRNIRMSLAIIDLTAPYILYTIYIYIYIVE